MDHFVPLSIQNSLRHVPHKPFERLLIPACKECNFLAGAKVFDSIIHKRRYIQDRLRNRYSGLLDMPEWTETELCELGRGLREYVTYGKIEREWVSRRLKWTNKDNRASASIVKIRFRLSDIGRSSVRTNAVTPFIRKSGKRPFPNISIRKRGKSKNAPRVKPLIGKCVTCGDEFNIYGYQNPFYCSLTCRRNRIKPRSPIGP